MRNNYPHRDICISFICTFLKWSAWRNTKHFVLKNLILVMVFCFANVETGQCCRDKACVASTAIRSAINPVSAISVVEYINGDYRPLISNANFSIGGNSPYSWEIYLEGVWTPTDNPPQVAKPSRIIIGKPGINGGISSANSYNDIIILNGGELILTDDAIPTQNFLNKNGILEVQEGGKLIIQGDIKLSNTSSLIIRNGSSMILDQNSISNIHSIWDGIETFEEGSTVTIKDWKWSALITERSLINISTAISNNADGYKFGNLVIDINPINTWTIIGGSTGIINLCENDLVINNSSTNFVTGASNETGINGFIVNGNMTINKGSFGFGSSFSNGNFNHQFIINGEFKCVSSSVLKIHHFVTQPAALNGFVTFKSNVTIAPSVTFTNDASSSTITGGNRMYLNLDGGTSANPILLDIAPTAVAISMNIKPNSYIQLKEHDLNTNSTTDNTAIFTVENGGTLDFNWALDGITPLMIKKNGSGGTNRFVSEQGSILKISSPDGLSETTAMGNVQYTKTNKTYNQLTTFWYIGKTNQATGNGLGTSSSGRQVIIEMANNNLSITLTQSCGFTDATTISATGGKLDIRKGQFIETRDAFITGTSNGNNSGTLYMSPGTLYKIASLSSADVEPIIPRMPGVAFPYVLNGGTIELCADGDQTLRGGRVYNNLTFSTKGIKTVSSAPASINGTILVADAAILNVDVNTMGGAGTNLTMTGTSKYITGGVGTKPDAQGTYSLGPGTTIEFTNSNNATMQDIRLGQRPITYNHIIVSGNNVGNSSLASTPVTMQTGSIFTVTNTGVFRHQNVNGFSGSNNTCITDVPTIFLEENATIDYYRDDGAGQNISNRLYKNLLLSGSGNINAPPGILTIQGNLTKTGTGKFIHNNGTVFFNGTTAQTYTSTIPVMLFNNLTNNNTVGLNISNDIEVYKEFLLGAGSKTILNAGNIILRSDKTNTANVEKIPSDAKIIYNGAGRFVVERFINTGLIINGQHPKSWQFLATPAFGESVSSTWQENKTNSANYGAWITNNDAANWNTQGFDGYSSGGPSMKTYDAVTNNWIGIANTNINLENEKGYMLFVRGDRTVNALGQDAKPTTLRTKGKLYSPEIGFTPQSITVPANSYGSIGNPYASRVDLEYMVSNGLLSGIDGSFYIWDPLLYGSYGVGGYQTISKSLGYKPIPGNPTQYYAPTVKCNFIESGQAFFVHNSTGVNGRVSFTENSKAKESHLVNRGESVTANSEILRTYLYTQKGIIADGNAVVFDTDFSNSIDKDDALKITNGGENFGLSREGKILAVEARRWIENTDSIFYEMRNLAKQTYQLRFVAENIKREFAAILIDKFLQSKTSLNLADSNFLNFSITDDPASSALDRFMLVFIREVALPVTFTSVKAYRQNANVVVEWKVEDETHISNYTIEKSANGNRFISSDKQMAKNTTVNNYNWFDAKPYDGYNYYRIKSTGINNEIKYSEVVSVYMGKENPSIIVYPNPVKNGTINLQLINQPAGIYKMLLLNTSGQVMVSKEIIHPAGSSIENIFLNKYAASGVYQLEIINPAGEKRVMKVRN